MAVVKKRRMGILTKLLVAFGAVYVIGTLLSQQMQIKNGEKELEALLSEIGEQKIENQRLTDMINESDTDEFYADLARDKLGYAQRGERVFVDISSN